MMKTFMRLTIYAACLLISLPLLAGEVRELSWEDLVPAHLLAEDPTAGLSEELQGQINWIIFLRENLPGKEPEAGTEKLEAEMNRGIEELQKKGIDIDELVALREKISTSMVDTLNGKRVRIPGYLLPIELSGAKATEFLLVPYMGACIHTPPPPPNQIVHVKASKGGYKNDELFEPVWVTGMLSVQSLVKDLYLSDGSADINIGYSMKARKIEPYKN